MSPLYGLYDDAGIDGGSSYSGRHWFIAKLAHSGISPKVIMTLAGHKHLTTTQRYIDVNDEIMRAAVDALWPNCALGSDRHTSLGHKFPPLHRRSFIS
ncbi:MAG TPA: tyrosine-type recombinase/integrase [Aliidongia sp.]|nr:tyrosine-type recombinase/integrase [Aliidongia sp.]